MLDARAQDASVEAVAQLALEVAIQFATEKGRDVVGLDRVNQGFQQLRVKGLQVSRLSEDQIGGIFDLPQAPLHTQVQTLDKRTIALGQHIQARMQGGDVQLSRQCIGHGVVGNVYESVVAQFIGDATLAQLGGQPSMAIVVDL